MIGLGHKWIISIVTQLKRGQVFLKRAANMYTNTSGKAGRFLWSQGILTTSLAKHIGSNPKTKYVVILLLIMAQALQLGYSSESCYHGVWCMLYILSTHSLLAMMWTTNPDFNSETSVPVSVSSCIHKVFVFWATRRATWMVPCFCCYPEAWIIKTPETEIWLPFQNLKSKTA